METILFHILDKLEYFSKNFKMILILFLIKIKLILSKTLEVEGSLISN